ncbi:DNA adenine methylase [Deinococcus soli (ex Cha et al. 2016)]|uniref:DNA adenine methylase n=1 Tax=Deinococcus soli (ex Cha et al. 2016) TaxID=1309411 RepID=UPI001664CEF0|nr:DNA adenine methylase [Deinococcus soli (ex Cha et al. 2016)]GGB68921.1 SAM-dependent methyltransferase [Deinococcus soli (ex Cha et al. 2016)]
MTVAPVLRWPGAKWRIAEFVVSHLPAHDVYIEPYFGSGAVFFNKDVSRVEIINDLDSNVVTLFRVLREQADALTTLISLTPWSEQEYHECWTALDRGGLSDLERARCLIVVTWQQMGRKPVTQRSSWRFRDVRGQSPITAWSTLPERIQHAASRLAAAQVSQMPAIRLIEQTQGPDTLVYADPPYLSEIRSGARMYEHEMRDRAQHDELIDALRAHLGPVVLSAYANEYYSEQLPGWHTVSTAARTQTNAQRAETLWLNPVAFRRLTHISPVLLGGSTL